MSKPTIGPDSHWELVQTPGVLLRARHSAQYGKLALVLARSYEGPKPSNGYPPNRYVKMQWCSTGERFEESLTNANNCWDVVEPPGQSE